MRLRRPLRWVIRTTLAVVVLAGCFLAARLWAANFATVTPGRIYRSGQMSAGTLGRTVHTRHIKSVLNLRGDNPKERWYRAERSATLDSGATQIDVHMASDLWLSRTEARTLVKILDSCEYPLLIHCEWGAERTGLVSAVATLLRSGSSLADARRQFSLYYLFLPVGDGAVMAKHLDLYAQWLAQQHVSHSPERFRRWITTVYEPDGPSRELWPYDPYPPMVVSRPWARIGPTDRGAPRVWK